MNAIRLCAGVAAALLALFPLAASAHPDSFAPLVKEQRPKIVHIKTKANSGEERAREPFGPFRPPELFQGMGSGFLVSANGLIVTNFHVVQGSQFVEVVLSDERTYTGRVVGFDERTDLALLQIEEQGLPFVRFGDSGKLFVGDWVIAIGNPLGHDHSVTAGIISAKGRNIFDAENVAYGEFIQTDAAINPGNSGGPLFNLDGEVIGVNTAISSRGHGIGFAVPSNLVVGIVDQLRTQGRVVRGWLGVVIQEATMEWNRSMGLPDNFRGIIVNDIVPEAPAARSDLRRGDVIVAFEEVKLAKVPQLQKLVAFSMPGSHKPIRVMRQQAGGSEWRTLEMKIEIGYEPSERGAAWVDESLIGKLGISTQAVPEAVRRSVGLTGSGGVQVERVDPGGVGKQIGLAPGDIILEVNRQAVSSLEELTRILTEHAEGRIPVLVQRERKTLYLTLPAEQLR